MMVWSLRQGVARRLIPSHGTGSSKVLVRHPPMIAVVGEAQFVAMPPDCAVAGRTFRQDIVDIVARWVGDTERLTLAKAQTCLGGYQRLGDTSFALA